MTCRQCGGKGWGGQWQGGPCAACNGAGIVRAAVAGWLAWWRLGR